MKPCPFCAESIQDAAIKCRYCGSLLVPEEMAEGALPGDADPSGARPGGGRLQGPRLPILWIAVAVACLVAAAIGVALLMRAQAPRAPERTAAAPPPAPVSHRFLDIAWGKPANEVAAQLASRGFRFTEQDEEGDHVFQGDIDGHPAVVIAMLSRGGLAKTIVIMVGEGDPAVLYAETNKRLAAEYGEPRSSTTANGQPVTRWTAEGGEGTQLWTTITERGDVAIHYESELWPAEARRRRAVTADMT